MRYTTDRYGRVYVDRGLGWNGVGAAMFPANDAPIAELTELPVPQPPTSASCCLSNTGLCYCTTGNRSVLSPGACAFNAPRCDEQPGPISSGNVNCNQAFFKQCETTCVAGSGYSLAYDDSLCCKTVGSQESCVKTTPGNCGPWLDANWQPVADSVVDSCRQQRVRSNPSITLLPTFTKI